MHLCHVWIPCAAPAAQAACLCLVSLPADTIETCNLYALLTKVMPFATAGVLLSAVPIQLGQLKSGLAHCLRAPICLQPGLTAADCTRCMHIHTVACSAGLLYMCFCSTLITWQHMYYIVRHGHSHTLQVNLCNCSILRAVSLRTKALALPAMATAGGRPVSDHSKALVAAIVHDADGVDRHGLSPSTSHEGARAQEYSRFLAHVGASSYVDSQHICIFSYIIDARQDSLTQQTQSLDIRWIH